MRVVGLIALAAIILAVALGPFRFALLIAALLLLFLAFHAVKWAFWPRSSLPRNRIRHQRIRLFLHLHPGRGHATLWELHRHWGRRACYRRIRQVRSS